MTGSQLEDSIQTVRMGRQRFLYGLDHIQEERITWSPSDAAKTPLELAGRCAGFLDFNAYVIRNRSTPEASGGLPPAPDSRHAAWSVVAASFSRLEDTIAGLTEADL